MFRSLLLTLFMVGPAVADDWPQFLGPKRDNSTPESINAWTEAPATVWTVPLGDGHSSPVVADGVVYAFYQPKGKNADALAAFDAETGDQKWEKSYDREKFTPPFGLGPRGTPVVHEGKVYTFGNTGILACWNVETGELLWKVDTLEKFNAKNLLFGISTSPTIMGEYVVVMVGGEGHGIVGFNLKDGREAWSVSDDPASYASPLPMGDHAIFLTGSHVRAISSEGKSLWEFPFKDKLNESSTTPVAVDQKIVASSVTAGSVMVQPNDGTVEPIWKKPALTCYFSTPVLVGDYLYMVNGAASMFNPSITLRCVEAKTGKIIWAKENIGKYHAAMIHTANDKLLMLSDNGDLILLEPNKKEYLELCRSKVCGETWAHPALSDGYVYVRDNKNLLCIKLK